MNCGPLSLMYVHRLHGQALTKRRARQLCCTTEDGTSFPALASAMRALGYQSVEIRENLTFNQLRRLRHNGYDVIVAWVTPFLDSAGGVYAPPDEWGCHWSVVKAVLKRSVTLYDPDIDDITSLAQHTFHDFWHDSDRGKHLVHAAVIGQWKMS